jgi:hypothetical protein
MNLDALLQALSREEKEYLFIKISEEEIIEQLDLKFIKIQMGSPELTIGKVYQGYKVKDEDGYCYKLYCCDDVECNPNWWFFEIDQFEIINK